MKASTILGTLLKLLAPPKTQRSKARSAGSKRAGSPAQPFLESPGQTGPGATRELSAAEIRNLKPSYAPDLDGEPDPGEVVWTWVPYVENDGRGKDRPVLIIARIDEHTFAGCYLSTKQHRGFVPVGTGGWDSQKRQSFLAPDRVLRVTSAGMRREGTVLERSHFDHAVAEISKQHGITARS